MKISRDFESLLERRIKEPLNLMQVILGPRQVGKTTGVRHVFERFNGPKHFATADSPIPLSPEWLKAQWETALAFADSALLVIDEVQKVPGWAEVCKLIFDQHRSKRKLKVLLLGSASLSIQEGLASALAGRFELIKVNHWDLLECSRAFSWDLDTYLKFGGYPAAAELIHDPERWQSYIRDSVIEPVLGRDISGLVRINKPALFRQAFKLALNYPAQSISYQKLLGQLQEGGNAATIKHYLELFEGAFLIKLLPKYSGSSLGVATSSPKILPLAPALCNAMIDSLEKMKDPLWQGRLFEAAVGARLSRLPGRLYYWAEGSYEIDFVHEVDGEITGYEVKLGVTHRAKSIAQYKKRFPDSKIKIIEHSNATSFFSA